jgi:hypothetical protein
LFVLFICWLSQLNLQPKKMEAVLYFRNMSKFLPIYKVSHAKREYCAKLPHEFRKSNIIIIILQIQ